MRLNFLSKNVISIWLVCRDSKGRILLIMRKKIQDVPVSVAKVIHETLRVAAVRKMNNIVVEGVSGLPLNRLRVRLVYSV